MPSVRIRSGGDFAVGPRAFDGQRAAVQQMHAAVDVELVALGVAAEVVVIVEHQHAAARRAGAEEVCGRESADAAADDDEVERFAGLGDRSGRANANRAVRALLRTSPGGCRACRDASAGSSRRDPARRARRLRRRAPVQDRRATRRRRRSPRLAGSRVVRSAGPCRVLCRSGSSYRSIVAEWHNRPKPRRSRSRRGRVPPAGSDVDTLHCPSCGEKALEARDLTFMGLMSQVFQSLSSLDSRLLRSLRVLIDAPRRHHQRVRERPAQALYRAVSAVPHRQRRVLRGAVVRRLADLLDVVAFAHVRRRTGARSRGRLVSQQAASCAHDASLLTRRSSITRSTSMPGRWSSCWCCRSRCC